ncbi:MAG: helix-turn-helix domain-containing protein [Halofilum sp. (in: g-proteobacteria)]
MTIEDNEIVYPGNPGLNDPAAFPARLEALIGGMSVRAFARKAGVSDTFLRQCLAGRTEPTRTKLLAIAEAGGTTVEWIATGRAEPSSQPAPAVADRLPIDRELLESIIEIAEQVLEDAGSRLSAGRKARLISALYEMHAGSSRESISRETIHRLVASTV